ncbi:MAG: SPOR domain-containing protein [Gemmobacter sp.]|uniref:SPOR domain-containing protein n=1 Tax=Gemmobacter sp. TaxID=1898957 RepID=UPI001A49E2A1|nr:SPOR domain-containing protein [Gemmobacter sp.]MBL8560962.1 SPOR domain-containing protein [Gemmobacter sp.]
MAELNYDRYAAAGYDGHAAAPRRRSFVTMAGGIMSLGLALGAGWWGYKIAVRNVVGIPVIKAMEGPMRVAPENPGGAVTAHQGLSVNDVAAVGAATPLPEEIILAPRAVDLAEEDAPGLAPQPPAALLAPVPQEPAALPEQAAADLPLDPLTTVAPLGASPEISATADVLALADSLAAGAAPLSEAPSAETPVADAPVVPGGLGTSLRPLARPAGRAVASPSGTDAAVAAALQTASREVDATALAAGTRLVQFGAFDTEDEARAAWDRIAGQFGELMAGKGRVIQSATSGGRTFYRLRAEGFADEADARRFCSALTAESTDCIPVTLR